MEDWNRLTQKASPMPDGMLTYFLDITESYGQACAAISRELALPSAHLLDPSGDMELKNSIFRKAACMRQPLSTNGCAHFRIANV